MRGRGSSAGGAGGGGGGSGGEGWGSNKGVMVVEEKSGGEGGWGREVERRSNVYAGDRSEHEGRDVRGASVVRGASRLERFCVSYGMVWYGMYVQAGVPDSFSLFCSLWDGLGRTHARANRVKERARTDAVTGTYVGISVTDTQTDGRRSS